MSKVIKGQWTQGNDYVTAIGSYVFGEAKHITPQGQLTRIYGQGWDSPMGMFMPANTQLNLEDNRKIIEAHHESVVLGSFAKEEPEVVKSDKEKLQDGDESHGVIVLDTEDKAPEKEIKPVKKVTK